VSVLDTTLPNGLRVVVSESRAAPVVALQVWVGVGSADETEAQGGLAHVHEHMLFKGTASRGVGEIAATVEKSGGEINAWTSYDQTVYHVVMGSRYFDTGLDVLADAIQRSAFDKDELGRELEVILEEIKRSEDQPGSRTSRALFETAFTQHPYRRPVIGYSKVVAGFTRDDVLAFFNAHYRADRLTVIAVGDVDPETATKKIAQAFSGSSKGATPLALRPREPEQAGIRAKGLVDDVEESHLAIGFRGPSLLDEDMPAVDVLSVLLGQGESSRLVSKVKRELQLVNECYAYAYTPKDPGLVVVGASLQHEKLDAAIAALGAEVRKLVDARPKPSEIEKAKTMLASEAIYGKETVEGVARRIGTWTLLTGDPTYEARYQERVAKVTADDVRSAAERLFSPERANVVALAPRSAEAAVDAAHLAEVTTRALSGSGAAKKAKATARDGVVRVQLPSGTRVIVERDTTNPIVTVRAAWLGGLRGESDATAGYTHLTSELVPRGTRTMPAEVFAETLDAMAGHVDAFAGRNSFGMRASFLRPQLDRGLPMFFDAMLDAAFAPEELERVRAHVLEDMKNKLDNPAGLAFELFGRSLWLTHPYRRDVLGTPASVKAATPEALQAFWKARAFPSQAVFTFVGDVDPDEAIEAVTTALAGAPDGNAAKPAPGTEAAPTSPRVARLVRARAQAHLVTGVRGLTLEDDDRFALELLSSTLSGQGGRLFLELRDKQSLCYSVSSFAVEGIEPGSFAVYMGTSPDKVDRALAGIDAMLAAVSNEGITPAELERGKRYLIGSHQIGLQRLGSRASAMALNELYGLGHLAHRAYEAKIDAVRLDDVQRVTRKVLAGARVTTVVGPEGTGGPAATLDPPA
jgi:zinc protease